MSKIVNVSHPETYVIFKQCIEGEKNVLKVKNLFRLLGGAWFGLFDLYIKMFDKLLINETGTIICWNLIWILSHLFKSFIIESVANPFN